MSSPGSSGFAVDLLAEPWRYPGPVPTTSGLLHDGTFRPGDLATIDTWLQATGSAPLDARHAVVAVGANASPGVVRTKLADTKLADTKLADTDTTVPMVRAVLTDVAVGHSAHLSLPGYVAAAPYRRPGARTEVVVTFVTDAQLERLDQTEPNYTRRRLVVGLELDDGSRPRESWLYVSRRGVIALPGGKVLPLGTQADLWAVLSEVDAVLRSFAAPDGAPARREVVRERLLELGMVRPSGLAHLAPAARDRP